MSYRWFEDLSERASRIVGHPYSFAVAACFVGSWLVAEWFWNMGRGWSLLADAFTLTLLFLMQRANNKFADATQAKLDKLARRLGVEEAVGQDRRMTDEEIQRQRDRECDGGCES